MALTRDRIIETLHRTKALPPFPAVLFELERELRRPNPSLPRLVSLIEEDPALSAQVLRVVRSSLFGLTTPVRTVERAVTLLGMLQIRRIVTAAAVMNSLRPLAPPAASGYWTHSLATGLASQALLEFCVAEVPEEVRDLAFTSGLLHDVGVLVLHYCFPVEYGEFQDALKHSETPCEELEYEHFGIDHAEVGMRLGQRWDLPPALSEAIGTHHSPWVSASPNCLLGSLVHVANFACHNQGLGREGAGAPRLFDAAAWMQLGLAVDQVGAITDRVRVEGTKSVVFASNLYAKAG